MSSYKFLKNMNFVHVYVQFDINNECHLQNINVNTDHAQCFLNTE